MPESWKRFLKARALHPMYPVWLAGLAALDLFVVIIPVDGILIASILLTPRRWLVMSLATALGSAAGSLGLAALLASSGVPILERLFPGMTSSPSWAKADQWVDQYGLWTLLGVSLLPGLQHPVIGALALSGASLFAIFAITLVGRVLRYLVLGSLGAYAPERLLKLRFLGKELEQTKDGKS